MDAICINQRNLKERNHQVQQMRAIYSKAALVLVWFSASNEKSDAAMDYLEGQTDVALICENSATLRINTKAGLRDIFARPWWSRMWVVQEVALAAKILL